MPTTSNFGWTTPADTDLVKDGAAAIRTLGNGIDTSFLDLKGGTTDQVLAKNSNSDLDFKWVADATGIPATIFDAKGDIIAATAADTASRLAVGTNGQVLTADSTTATGLKWAASGGFSPTSWTLINTGGTALTGASTVTISGINHSQLFILIFDASSANAASLMSIRPNGDSAANYTIGGTIADIGSTYSTGNFYGQGSYSGVTSIAIGKIGAAAGTLSGSLFIDSAATTGWKRWSYDGGGNSDGGGSNFVLRSNQGIWEASSAITSIDIISSTGNFDAGTIYVLGAA